MAPWWRIGLVTASSPKAGCCYARVSRDRGPRSCATMAMAEGWGGVLSGSGTRFKLNRRKAGKHGTAEPKGLESTHSRVPDRGNAIQSQPDGWVIDLRRHQLVSNRHHGAPTLKAPLPPTTARSRIGELTEGGVSPRADLMRGSCVVGLGRCRGIHVIQPVPLHPGIARASRMAGPPNAPR